MASINTSHEILALQLFSPNSSLQQSPLYLYYCFCTPDLFLASHQQRETHFYHNCRPIFLGGCLAHSFSVTACTLFASPPDTSIQHCSPTPHIKRRVTNRLAKMRAKDVIHYAFIVFYFALFTAGYVVLDIWLCRLFQEFHHRHRGGDTRYGIAAFSFFTFWAVCHFLCLLITLFPQYYTPSFPGPLGLFVDMAVRIVFFIRFSTWLSHFKIREETENVAYCIACLFALAWGW